MAIESKVHTLKNPLLFDELKQRAVIFQQTAEVELEEHLKTPRIVYCGIDPTADSLHVGHLLQLINLKRYQDAGHKPIVLLGGATALIGDPSFKAAERQLLTLEQVKYNTQKIALQVSHILKSDSQSFNNAEYVNNIDWLSKVSLIDLLRDVGKHFSVNAMIQKESVKQRLNREGDGISFTEFTYSVLQGMDFAHLNEQFDCTVQFGGSDQWGNIIAGVDYGRRKNRSQLYGVTLPLIVKPDGGKFGKTESGTVWLDPNRTSPYAFYQFWLNVSDAEVYKLLMKFSFLTVEAIQQLQHEDEKSQHKPQAQGVLAAEMTRLIHGDEGLDAAQRIAAALFKGDVSRLTRAECMQLGLDGLPRFELQVGQSLVDILIATQMASSKRAAREFITNGAVKLNSQASKDVEMLISNEHLLHDQFVIIQRGKKNHAILVAPDKS